MAENLYYDGQGEMETGTVTVDPGSVGDEATLDVDVTVAGVLTSDILVAMQPSADLLADLQIVGIAITAANTITVRFANDSGGALDQASATWKYAYIRPTQ